MRAQELAVSGVFTFEPETFSDHRGAFVAPMQHASLLATVGLPVFPVAQASLTVSRRGVVRGIHFTRTPPGGAKYVYCVHGRAREFIVDIRVGSPTYGRWDVVELDGESARAVYLPIGVGLGYVALADDTVMSYLLTTAYQARNELAISISDPALGLPVTDGLEPILSERDTAAPTLAQAGAAGLLPDYAVCRQLADMVGSTA